MYKVRKRNGKVVNFEISKISNAMKKAFEATERKYDDDMIDFLAIKVTSDFENKIKDDIINVEDIQDSVESVLIKGDYVDVTIQFKVEVSPRFNQSEIFNVAGIIDQFRKGISFNKTLLTSGINDINNELGIFKSNNILDIMNDLGLKLSISNLLKAGNIISKDIIIYWDLVDLFKDILDYNDLTPAEFIERTLKQDKFNLSNIITKISNSDFNRNNIINAVTQIIMATKIDYNLIK